MPGVVALTLEWVWVSDLGIELLGIDKCTHSPRLKGNQPHGKIIRNPVLQNLLLIIVWKSFVTTVFHDCRLGHMR